MIIFISSYFMGGLVYCFFMFHEFKMSEVIQMRIPNTDITLDEIPKSMIPLIFIISFLIWPFACANYYVYIDNKISELKKLKAEPAVIIKEYKEFNCKSCYDTGVRTELVPCHDCDYIKKHIESKKL